VEIFYLLCHLRRAETSRDPVPCPGGHLIWLRICQMNSRLVRLSVFAGITMNQSIYFLGLLLHNVGSCEVVFHKQLQQHLNTLVDWSHTWLMTFNAAKCHLLKITRKTKFLDTEYKIENHTLLRLQHHPYLGLYHCMLTGWHSLGFLLIWRGCQFKSLLRCLVKNISLLQSVPLFAGLFQELECSQMPPP
jgi:hypothetical protein